MTLKEHSTASEALATKEPEAIMVQYSAIGEALLIGDRWPPVTLIAGKLLRSEQFPRPRVDSHRARGVVLKVIQPGGLTLLVVAVDNGWAVYLVDVFREATDEYLCTLYREWLVPCDWSYTEAARRALRVTIMRGIAEGPVAVTPEELAACRLLSSNDFEAWAESCGFRVKGGGLWRGEGGEMPVVVSATVSWPE